MKKVRIEMIKIVLLVVALVYFTFWIKAEIIKLQLRGKIICTADRVPLYYIRPNIYNRWLRIGITYVPLEGFSKKPSILGVFEISYTSWLKDGSKFIYPTIIDDPKDMSRRTYQIKEYDLKNQELNILLKLDTDSYSQLVPIAYPSLSPDGELICFLGGANINRQEYWSKEANLYMFKVKDSNREIKKISGLHFSLNEISWSPESKKVLLSTEDGRVVFVNVETGDIEEILKGTSPILSKDGKIVAFLENNNIYVSDINGKNKKLIVNDFNRSKYKPTNYKPQIEFSPDGKYLLYTRESNSFLWALVRTNVYDLIAVSIKHPFWRVRLGANSDYSDITWKNSVG